MELLTTIKLLCRQGGITVAELERRSGLSHSTIARWDRNAPSIDKVAAVADFFQISVDELIGRHTPEISEADRRVLDLLHRLNEDGQAAALAMLQGLVVQPGYIKTDHPGEMEA